MNYRRIIHLLFAITIIVTPLIVSMYIDIPIFDNNIKVISIYGIFVFVYMIIQMTFAYLNKLEMDKLCEQITVTENLYNILIVGYREEEELFEKCLISHKVHLFNPCIKRIIVVVDGNEEDDLYMSEIFMKVFGYNGKVFRGGTPSIITHKAICILQRHRGKRHVLYTGLKLSLCEKVNGVVCTDSDTEMAKYSVDYLIQTLESSDTIGAVTGMMEISNKVSIISFMSYIRYWFACNLERAYQSYNGIVLCVSGPIGIYRAEVIEKILEKFIAQTFMGNECTYGDDRHLTNNILNEGYKIKYNHLVKCKTDTPGSLFRFFNQQTRWCKSSYRELLWTLEHIHKHSIWLTVDIVYQTIYSLIVLSSLIYILNLQNINIILVYLSTILLMNMIKGIYASILEQNLVYLTYSLYGYIYIMFIIPSKIYAGITMSDTSWGTSDRKNIFDKINYGNIFMSMWVIALTCIISYSIIVSSKSLDNILLLSIISAYVLISFFCIKVHAIFGL